MVEDHLPILAAACELEEKQLNACVLSLVRYYQACFPDAARGVKEAFFQPIIHDDATDQRGKAASPAESDATLPGSASISPVMAAELPQICGGGAVASVSAAQEEVQQPHATCPSPSAGEIGAAAEAAATKLLCEEQSDRADTPESVIVTGVSLAPSPIS